MRSAHVPGSGTAPVDMAPVIGSNPVMVKPGAFAAADMPACAPLLRGAGKVARRAGWGAESRSGSIRVRSAGRAIRLALKRATPHPALRATFPSKAGEGDPRVWKAGLDRFGFASEVAQSDLRSKQRAIPRPAPGILVRGSRHPRVKPGGRLFPSRAGEGTRDPVSGPRSGRRRRGGFRPSQSPPTQGRGSHRRRRKSRPYGRPGAARRTQRMPRGDTSAIL